MYADFFHFSKWTCHLFGKGSYYQAATLNVIVVEVVEIHFSEVLPPEQSGIWKWKLFLLLN